MFTLTFLSFTCFLIWGVEELGKAGEGAGFMFGKVPGQALYSHCFPENCEQDSNPVDNKIITAFCRDLMGNVVTL